MKLLNKSIVYLSVSLFFIIGVCSIIFYFGVLNEIKESIDEGLDHYKRQIIFKVQSDSTILNKGNFDEGFFAVREISQEQAVLMKDTYIDTLMYMQDTDDEAPELEPIRLLKTAFEHNAHFYELRIMNSMVEEDDLAKELLRGALVFYLLLITLVVLINNVVLQRLWKPFYSFLSQLQQYRIGSSKNFPEVKTQTKEFKDLQHSVNILLQHNIETYEQQKEFIGNASHELQTPLAIATSKLELLIEKGSLQPEQAENIGEVMHIIERLVRLNKSLLLLTKIENKQFLENKTIFINELVQQTVSDLEEVLEFKNIKISVFETAQLYVQMDSSLANVIISNLLRNAIYHNEEKGLVTIEILKDAIRVNNTGAKKPLDDQKIFSRFYKSDNHTGSTGLGLAIVKAICELYGFEISYRFEGDRHSFELQFQ